MFLHDGPTTLRRLGPLDLRPFQAYRNDPDVSRFQSWTAMTDEEAAGFLAAMSEIDPLLRPGEWAQIGIALMSSNILIGDMGLFLSKDGTEAEVGITLARGHQGQGHAIRAVQMATAFLFKETKIGLIRGWADVRNGQSRKLLERAGFAFQGRETTDGIEEFAFVLHRPNTDGIPT